MGRRVNASPSVAIAYLRVSTEDQKLGPEAQRAAINVWAKKDGITIAAYFTDQGVSGGAEMADRPQLLAAMFALREHRAGMLLVAKRDRLARDPMIAAMIDREATRVGARIVSADGVGNGEGAAEQFMKTVIDAAAKYERDLIRLRTKAALAAKRSRGEMTGAPPFGYRLGTDGVHLEPDDDEQAIVAQVRRLRQDGVTYREITDTLKLAGVRSRGGRPLTLARIHAIAASLQ